MSWFRHDSQFSQGSLVPGIERYFGLPGYARLLKLYEAASANNGQLLWKWSQAEERLSGKQKTLEEFFLYLEKARTIRLTMTDCQVTIEVLDLPAKTAEPVVDPGTLSPYFHDIEQWRIWLRMELCYTDRQSHQPGGNGILKQWIAGHITVDEVGEAIDQCVVRGLDIKQLASLHHLIVEARKGKLAEARKSC